MFMMPLFLVLSRIISKSLPGNTRNSIHVDVCANVSGRCQNKQGRRVIPPKNVKITPKYN